MASHTSKSGEIVAVRPAGPGHQVVTVRTRRAPGHGHSPNRPYRRRPCAGCPWRVDQVGAFPPESFRLSARVAYDMAESVFACHDTRVVEKAAICAGFLLRGAAHSLAIRLAYMRGQIDPASISDAGLELHKSYRAMAVANGVAGDDPVLAPCRAAEG
jgi:hypothetical protein